MRPRGYLKRRLPDVRGVPGRLRRLPGALRTGNGARRWQRVCATAVLALCLLSCIFGGAAFLLRPGNDAVTDGAGTKALIDDVRTPLAQVLTYDYGDTGSTQQAAKRLFAGDALRQYREMFGRIKTDAVRDRTVVTSIVRQVGVVTLHGGQARLLAFVDQQVLAGRQQKRAGSAQLDLRAKRLNGTWKITHIAVL